MKKLFAGLMMMILACACAFAEEGAYLADYLSVTGCWRSTADAEALDAKTAASIVIDEDGGVYGFNRAGDQVVDGRLRCVFAEGGIRYGAYGKKGDCLLSFFRDTPRQIRVEGGDVYELEGAITVQPQVYYIDPAKLEDGLYPAAFEAENVAADENGVYIREVRLYTEDVYDIVDVSLLGVGDTIIAEGSEVTVKTISHDGGMVYINSEEDGVRLTAREDTNGYFFCGFDGCSAYTEACTVTLAVSEGVAYTDASDLSAAPVTADRDGLKAAVDSAENKYFSPYNTVLRIENGKIVEISRIFIP